MIQRLMRYTLLTLSFILAAALARNLWEGREGGPAEMLLSWPLAVLLVLAFVGLRLPGPTRAPGSAGASDAEGRRRRPLLVAFIVAACAVVATYEVTLAYVDQRLAARTFEDVVNDPYKVWGARGLVPSSSDIVRDGQQNSIESIRLAFERGAKGCEVDGYFDVDLGHFIVSHDRPYNLKNGKLLHLSELMAAIGDRGYIWLDFKKLGHLDKAALAAAVSEICEIADTHSSRDRIYVEGEDPINLGAFRDAGFPTIFDTQPLHDSSFVTPALMNLYKAAYYFAGFTVMAMDYGEIDEPTYGPRTRRALGQIPVFIYHVDDDAETLQALADTPAVRSILVNDQSLDRYGFHARQ